MAAAPAAAALMTVPVLDRAAGSEEDDDDAAPLLVLVGSFAVAEPNPDAFPPEAALVTEAGGGLGSGFPSLFKHETLRSLNSTCRLTRTVHSRTTNARYLYLISHQLLTRHQPRFTHVLYHKCVVLET
jgi:hypothetical protein